MGSEKPVRISATPFFSKTATRPANIPTALAQTRTALSERMKIQNLASNPEMDFFQTHVQKRLDICVKTRTKRRYAWKYLYLAFTQLEINIMKLLSCALLVCAFISVTSCAKIFQTPDAEYLAQIQTTVAIIPPNVSIQARMFVDAESIKEQQRTESLSIQAEMYSWLLRRKMQGKIFQEFLDIETTNARLKKLATQRILNCK